MLLSLVYVVVRVLLRLLVPQRQGEAAKGSIEAEKLLIYRSYDPTPAAALARQLAGLDPGSTA